MKIMLSVSVSLAFSHNVHNIRFEQQIRILSELTVIDLGPPELESSIRISKFYNSTHSELKFHKARIENWLSIGFELGSPWLRTCSHKHFTILNLQCKGESYSFIYPFSQSWSNPGDLSLSLNCTNALKICTQRPE